MTRKRIPKGKIKLVLAVPSQRKMIRDVGITRVQTAVGVGGLGGRAIKHYKTEAAAKRAYNSLKSYADIERWLKTAKQINPRKTLRTTKRNPASKCPIKAIYPWAVKGYTHFVQLPDGSLESGWWYREDAMDQKNELKESGISSKVIARKTAESLCRARKNPARRKAKTVRVGTRPRIKVGSKGRFLGKSMHVRVGRSGYYNQTTVQVTIYKRSRFNPTIMTQYYERRYATEAGALKTFNALTTQAKALGWIKRHKLRNTGPK